MAVGLRSGVSDYCGNYLNKRHLDNALTNMLYLLISPEVVRQLDSLIVVGPFQLNCSVCSTWHT